MLAVVIAFVLILVSYMGQLTKNYYLFKGIVHYRNHRPSQFSALHFDNPIYRRTVEDLDADLENPVHDNTLGKYVLWLLQYNNLIIGAISILPNTGAQNSSEKQSEVSANLVVEHTPERKLPKKIGSSVVDIRDPTQYSYDQPSLNDNGNA